MSMIRQMALIVAAAVLLSILGSIGVAVYSTRAALEEQWRVRNADAATMLALALSQQKGDPALLELVLAAQFDTGHYRRIRLVLDNQKALFERESPYRTGSAPDWLPHWLPMQAKTGVAIVTDGWKSLGRVELESHSAWAYDALWQSLLRSVSWLLFVGALTVLVVGMAVQRWRRGLDQVLAQAQALEAGRFEELAEPRTVELQRLTAGMNSMVRRMHALFDEHAAQLAALQRQVQTDALTGLANRRHFLVRLEHALDASAPEQAETPLSADPEADTIAEPVVDGPRRGGLLMVRLSDIESLNAKLGHAVVDRLLAAIGEVLQTYPSRVEGSFAGRLNGRDVALYLPANGMARESAHALRDALTTVLAVIEPSARVCIGGVEGLQADGSSDALARADEALAKAELQIPSVVQVLDLAEGEGIGESEWRARLMRALAAGHTQIAEYPVVLNDGRVTHLECPLRVQLEEGGPYVRAERWLPMAWRGQLMDQVDLAAARLALGAIARDGRPRSIHVSAAALADSGFVREFERRLAAVPQAAGKLSIEVDESATAHWRRWRDAAERWRPLGVRLGIDNTGRALEALADARSYGVDYLKVDSRFIRGLASDTALADFARQLVATARAMGVSLYAEGVDDLQDLRLLWTIGFDGATGPAVTASR
jgi:EAL domain-containing protein (putative c-di-GMP-specific phosphodiesterase class I)/GGDEF domain-containing protein